MSKRKIWNVNEKKHYKMYKNGKQWFFAGMGIVAGLFGAGSTTIASADETPRGANLDLSKSKNLLATKTSATIPGSTSAANSQSTNSTHNSVTNSTSVAKQNAQTSASQAASKAGSASLSASLKAAQDASASQQKASQSQAAAKAASQQKASEKTVKQSTTSSTKAKPASQTSTKGSQAASTTKQDTASANQAKSASQGSQSKTDPQSKASTDASNNQSSQSLSAVKSATDSAKQSRSLEAAKQSLSISQSMVDSLSRSTEKIDSGSTSDTPIRHLVTYTDEETGNQVFANDDDWRDFDDALVITAPRTDSHYVLDLGETEISIGIKGSGDDASGQPLADFRVAFLEYAKTATSIDDLNNWIRNSDYYKKYIIGNTHIVGVEIDWKYKKQDDQTKLVGQDITTVVGNPVDISKGVAEFTDANGNPGDVGNLKWDMYDENWNKGGDYPVTITYYDPATLQTKTVDITVHVVSHINITGKDNSTYEGHPLDIGDFVDSLTNGAGKTDLHPGDPNVGIYWDSSKIDWNKAGVYENIEIIYKDLTTGETTSTTVTVTVLRNQEEIHGDNATYTVGQGPHLTVDDLNPSGKNADGSDASGFEADFSHVD